MVKIPVYQKRRVGQVFAWRYTGPLYSNFAPNWTKPVCTIRQVGDVLSVTTDDGNGFDVMSGQWIVREGRTVRVMSNKAFRKEYEAVRR